MRKNIFLVFIYIFLLAYSAFAANSSDNKQDDKWIFPYAKEIGIVSGYGHGNLKQKGSYKVIPVIVRLGFNLDSIGLGFGDLIRPLAKKLNMNPKGFTEFLLEPFINGVTEPKSNIETGCNFLLKYSYPLTERIYPYVLGGLGAGYNSQHVRTQSTQWGFISQAGFGFSYFIKKDMALSLEYRFRHFSNANTRQPNNGINTNMFLVGISFFK
jgi:opacity protein-like surface antigen